MATTPNYGWVTPDNTSFVKDGAQSIRTVSNSIDATSAGANFAGLVLIKTHTISSTVGSVQINNAFSSTYDSYKIVVSNLAPSGGMFLFFRIGTSASQSGYFYSELQGGGSYSNGLSGTSAASATFFTSTIFADENSQAGGTFDIHGPFLSRRTSVQCFGTDTRTYGAGLRYSTGVLDNSTSYTGLYLQPNGGNLTGGLIQVYGYRKAI